MMHRIIYTSTATDRMTSYELVRIVQLSARNNAARGVTGYLIYRDGRFIQMIEGEREELDKLIDIISRDDRHRGIAIIRDEPIEQRSVPNWRMKRLAPNGREALAELEGELAARGQETVPREVARFLQQAA